MREDPILRALDLLEDTERPSPEFADALFRQLLDEVDARPVRRPRRPRVSDGFRRAITIAAALALTVAVIVVILPLGRGGRSITPADVGPFGEIGPFRVTLERRIPAWMVESYFEAVAEEYADLADLPPIPTDIPDRVILLVVSFDGSDRWRVDYVSDSFHMPDVPAPGSFLVFEGQGPAIQYDAERTDMRPDVLAFFEAAGFLETPGNTYSESNLAPGVSPLNLLTWDATDEARRFWHEACADEMAEFASETVAGRDARRITCGPWSLWLDADTGLMLRMHLEQNAPALALPSVIPVLWDETQEVIAVEFDPASPDDTFVFTPPPGSQSAEEVVASTPPTGLRLGAQVPDFTLPLLGGGTFDPTPADGKPLALLFWADWCEPCTDPALADFEVAAGERTDIRLVSIATQVDRAAVESFVADRGLRVPVALDLDGGVLNEVIGPTDGIPLLVLVDSEGRFVGAYVGVVDALDAVLDALAAGEPLPHVESAAKEQIG